MNSYEKPDFWSRKAFSEGYPARSVYKLQEIDKKFESMADFIDAIGEELDTSMHKLKQCMSRETISTLRSYFIQDNALECVLRLAEEQVFDS